MKSNISIRNSFIQFPYVDKTELSKCETPTEQWLYLIKNHEDMSSIAHIHPSEAFLELERLANISNLSPEQRIQYDRSLKYYRDRNHEYNTAIDLGKEEGKREERKNMILASIPKLKAKGMTTNDIIDILNLTTDEINEYLID